ncbi:MAG: glutamine synthetase III [Candidatus Melainabacteria bacterium]|nr:glutamine synthetase III [Candidatus Melainabacteria bacterium]
MTHTINHNEKRSKIHVSKESSANASGRKRAVASIADRQPLATSIDYASHPVNEIFGTNVFNRQTMRAVLPKAVYKAVVRCLDHGEQLDPSMADTVANAMKDWAIARGATHYTHWFVPLHGYTAEKHDSFLVSNVEDGAVLEFSGKNLVQGEPDASSFPSGGIRSTFEARGYTGWDPSSPAFLMDSANGRTLCIPSVFCSFSGHALDVKTPLLRSLEVISNSTVRLLHALGNKDVKRVNCTVGPEQEYFLIDEAFYNSRPDIISAGRALFGARPPKGQEMEDHYWGSIRERVLAFMMDAEHELYRLGVPVKTRHNEVAPAQFEVAPVFESCNLATDHNMLLMEVFRKTAQKHGFRCLFHEKPFSGVNGSGKHNNWSLADDQGNNLLEPGDDPQEHLQFLVVLAAVIRAVDKYATLLRASIATAGNDHRLGANEAPPAIMSIYLGDALMKVVDNVISGKAGDKKAANMVQSGVSMLPNILKDDSDRNRTSPFAFTGNKFEFRAVGSSQSVAMPNTVLNTMVADSMDHLAEEIEKATKKGGDHKAAVNSVLVKTLCDHKRVLFNGDNYSEQWHEEASRRGLANLRNFTEALPVLIAPEAKELFERYGVLKEDELISRYHILLENYCKVINVESLLTSSIATTMILPAAIEYQTRLATAIVQTKSAVSGINLAHQENMLKDVSERIARLKTAIEVLDMLRHEQRGEDHIDDEHTAEAKFYQQRVIPAMHEVRTVADELELMVDDSLWPLPKFREMLYIY